jgi:hypothetical protein
VLVAFSLGCFACCVPCDPCDAACDETPDEAFAVVYQVEDDRANLTWTGDAMGPIDGPWPGFESGSAFSQTITSNNVLLPGSRFPCYFRLKLWRNVGGGEGSESLLSERVTISCTQGKLDLGFVVLNAGESVEFTTVPESSTATYVIDRTRIALDENGGDRHAHPPLAGDFGGTALCADTTVTVIAEIAWGNDLIQHNLYGEFVECFNDLGECEVDCSGTATAIPSDLYLSVTDSTGNHLASDLIEGEWVLSNTSDACVYHQNVIAGAGSGGDQGIAFTLIGAGSGVDPASARVTLWLAVGNEFVAIDITSADFVAMICGTPLSGSVTHEFVGGVMTFDWELST